jgi:PAS domain-containing serine/threonine kinase
MEDPTFCYCITQLHGTAWSDESTENGDKKTAMDLFECIEKFESFTEPAARHIFSQIVDAVAHLHDIGLVHRDIKDENILIDDKFHVKLIDFGSASFFDPTGNRKFDMFLGTKQYAAPEILMQQEYRGPEAEIWALGCCLYIILTGAVPFSSQKQATELPFTRPNRPLSASCLNLLNRMLEKSPDYRATLKEIRNHPWLTMNCMSSYL